MCVCTYACIYACMYVCMHECVHVCMYVCMYLCMHVCVHAWMCARVYVCMHLSVYACMCACMNVFMCVCSLPKIRHLVGIRHVKGMQALISRKFIRHMKLMKDTSRYTSENILESCLRKIV